MFVCGSQPRNARADTLAAGGPPAIGPPAFQVRAGSVPTLDRGGRENLLILAPGRRGQRLTQRIRTKPLSGDDAIRM